VRNDGRALGRKAAMERAYGLSEVLSSAPAETAFRTIRRTIV
jgi:hypothetical protein